VFRQELNQKTTETKSSAQKSTTSGKRGHLKKKEKRAKSKAPQGLALF